MYSEQKRALAAELSFKHPAVLAVSGSAGSGKTALLAALLPVLPGQETEDCSVMAWGFDPARMSADPFQGAYESVITSVAKLLIW